MDTDRQFYVYTHKRATDGRVFYVGKGKNGRINDTDNRNRHWRNIVSKHGFTAEIVMWFATEACAFSFERAMIKNYGRDKLCNMTDGGEGPSGAIRSIETREKIRAARALHASPNKGKTLSEEHKSAISKSKQGKPLSDTHRASMIGIFAGEKNPFFGKRHSEEMKAILSEMAMGRKPSDETIAKLKVARKERVGHKAPNICETVFTFKSDCGKMFSGTQYDFYTKHNLAQSNVSALVRGVVKSCKGWRISNDAN